MRLEAARDQPGEGHRIGVEYATVMAERLLAEGAPGLHYITLNRSTATTEIHQNLGVAVRDDRALASTPR